MSRRVGPSGSPTARSGALDALIARQDDFAAAMRDMRTEIAGACDQSKAQTQALLRVIDRLDG